MFESISYYVLYENLKLSKLHNVKISSKSLVHVLEVISKTEEADLKVLYLYDEGNIVELVSVDKIDLNKYQFLVKILLRKVLFWGFC